MKFEDVTEVMAFTLNNTDKQKVGHTVELYHEAHSQDVGETLRSDKPYEQCYICKNTRDFGENLFFLHHKQINAALITSL